VDDGGAFFGWGVEQGHLGKTEIFCKFDPQNRRRKPLSKPGIKSRARGLSKKSICHAYGSPSESAGLSNYHLWWDKIHKAIDPNGVSPSAGALV